MPKASWLAIEALTPHTTHNGARQMAVNILTELVQTEEQIAISCVASTTCGLISKTFRASRVEHCKRINGKLIFVLSTADKCWRIGRKNYTHSEASAIVQVMADEFVKYYGVK